MEIQTAIEATEMREIDGCKVKIVFANKPNKEVLGIILDSLSEAFYRRIEASAA